MKSLENVFLVSRDNTMIYHLVQKLTCYNWNVTVVSLELNVYR